MRHSDRSRIGSLSFSGQTPRHDPAAGRYDGYRACLRWELAFSCAFCLVHEADLREGGVARTGLTWIEHHVPQDDRRSPLAHAYANCFHSCRFCNRARGVAPVIDRDGRRLLEPCAVSWSERFVPGGDSLRPIRREGTAPDGDAEYTYETYDLDDPEKRRMRHLRADLIENALGMLAHYLEQMPRLHRAAERASTGDDRLVILQAMDDLERDRGDARCDLARFAAIPEDRDSACRCATADACTLPTWLAVREVALP